MKAINQDQNQVTKTWLNRQLRMIERHRGEDALAILGPIQSGLEHAVRNALESIPKRSDRLLVILDTPGGHVEVVVRLVTIMRKLFQSVSFLVPDRAMSAGTVLVMSGDAILMDYFSCLGPIDPQVKKGDTWVPALSYLRQFEALIEKSRNGTLTVAELALLKQLNLAELHQIELQGQLSVDLIKRWLVQYKFKDWTETTRSKTAVTQKLKEDRADQIAKILNQHDRWHSHGRGIGMDVLTSEEIRLKIDDYSADKKFHGMVWDYYTCLSDFASRNKLPGFVHTRSFF